MPAGRPFAPGVPKKDVTTSDTEPTVVRSAGKGGVEVSPRSSFHAVAACLLFASGIHACGGTVVDGRPPRERLRNDGATGCEAACKALIACPGKSSCDCACDCPPDAPNCCDACTCKPPNVDDCAKDCTEEVDKELAADRGCEGELLGLIDCAARGSCDRNSCAAENQAYKQCTSSNVGPPPAAPGPAGVSCSDASASASGGTSPQPGDVACDMGLSGCSDGHAYRLVCTTREDGEISCECSVDGIAAGVLVVLSCTDAPALARELCGWPG